MKKVNFILGMLIMAMLVSSAQAGLWSVHPQNYSFEAPDTGGKWSQIVDDWYKMSWWGSFVETGGGSGIPATPYGAQWGGVTGAGELLFQQVGTDEDDLVVPVAALLGHRANNTQGDVTLSIWTGGDVTVLNDYDPLTDVYHPLGVVAGGVGATMLDSVTLLDPWGAGNPNALLSSIAGTLSTGTTGTVGDPLWIAIESTGKVWVDNVTIPEPATLMLLGLGGLGLIRRKKK